MTTESREHHPEGLTENQENVILGLHDLNAIRFGEYKWQIHERLPEAPLMPIYTNFRMLQREPGFKTIAVDLYEDLASNLKFDLIAGIPTAAIPFSSSLSDRLSVGHLTPRMDAKTHGNGQSIDGMRPEDAGKTALELDDLVSFFGSKGKALEVLRAEGLKVTDVVVLMDYELGAEAEAQRYGVALHRSFTAHQMLDFSLRVGKVDYDTHAELQERFVRAQEYFKIHSSA